MAAGVATGIADIGFSPLLLHERAIPGHEIMELPLGFPSPG